MAKFNKDRFFNNITEKVQAAIDAHLLTDEDYETNNLERLHGCIQYLLVDNIEDRKFALDVLDDFDYDDQIKWKDMEAQFGEFKSLMDIALVNLWKYLESQGATEYSYYHKSDTDKDTPILDIARENDKFNGGSDNEHPSNEDERREVRRPQVRPKFRFGDEENEEV